MPGTPALPLRHIHKIVLLTLILAPLCAAHGFDDWNYEDTHSDTREFSGGGMLHVHLKVGDLHIRRGDANRISLRYTIRSRHEQNIKNSSVDFDVHGSDATLDFHAPTASNTSFDVELEVPANTSIDAHIKVGDLTVESVEGDKDLELGVGDIRVMREPSSYHLVRASTGIGDVNSDAYGETTGWLGKTLNYHGEGKYELHAHVGVGDITLEGK